MANGEALLTDRQRQVLQHITEGKSIKESATALFVSPKTIEFHRTELRRRLGITTTAGLIRYAVVHGIGEGILGIWKI